MVSDTVICKLQVLKPQQDSSESLRLLKKGELWPITARNKNPNCCFIKKKKKIMLSWIIMKGKKSDFYLNSRHMLGPGREHVTVEVWGSPCDLNVI